MTDQNSLQNGLSGVYNYLGTEYGTYQSWENDLVGQIQSMPGENQATKDALIDSVQRNQPLKDFFGQNEQDAVNQALSSGLLTGGGKYLTGTLSQYYDQVGSRLVANTIPDRHLGDMIETALTELNPPSNQNFPKVATVGKVMGSAGLGLGLGMAVKEVYSEYVSGGDWQGEAAKQSTILGTSTAIGTVVGTAVSPFFTPVGGAVVGSLVSGLVGYTMDKNWNEILDLTKAAADAGKTAQQAADDVTNALKGKFDDVLNNPSGEIQDIVDFGKGLLGDYAWGLDNPGKVLQEILPDWMTGAGDKLGAAKTMGSPLIFDLDSDGVELTTFNSASTQSFFDLDNDGYAEQTAWITGDDAFLARDINGNGKIDNASELFGSTTIDGFSILQELDSNGDFVIDANDVAWSELLLWQDIDGDGISKSTELQSLDSANIVSIDLMGASSSTQLINGNQISQTSTFKWTDGTTGTIVDAWFIHDNVNTFDITDYTLDARTLFLPTLRGFGELSDLHIAMSSDEGLLTMVQDFTTSFDLSGFSDSAIFSTDVKDILFRWAGVDGVVAGSRGGNFDAQKLGFLEVLLGEKFLQNGYNPDPEVNASKVLQEAWDDVFSTIKSQFLIQVGADQLFEVGTSYDQFTGQIEGDFVLSQSAIDGLVPFATAQGVITQSYWVEVVAFLDATKGLGSFTAGDDTILNTAIISSDSSLSWDIVRDLYTGVSTVGQTISGGSGDDILIGGEGDDTITDYYGNNTYYGRAGDDILNGGWFNDTLYGESGNDLIYGGDGDDILYGGTGDDYLEGGTGNNIFDPGLGSNQVRGGTGNDTYIYSGGDDVYLDAVWGGTDKIVMPVGVTLADLSFARVGAFDLLITVAGYGVIQINNQINNNYIIETIEFSDLSTFDLQALPDLVTHGTNANDSLSGVTQNSVAMNDTIYGYGGNDNITGSGGNDIIDGGVGNDYINAGAGDDTIIASPGFDVITPTSGYDTIVIPIEYGPEDISFIRKGDAGYTMYNNLYISVTGLGQIELPNQFVSTSVLEMITFASGATSIDLSTINYIAYGTEGDDYITGVESAGGKDDIMYGYSGNDGLNGRSGNDMLYGGAGNDNLYGGSGDDYLDGGDGNDILYGNSNDDTYMFSNGLDTIYESSGMDKMVFGNNITLEDLDFQVQNMWDVRIIYTPGVDETLAFYQVSGLQSYVIETLEFADGFNLNFADFSNWLWGTSGNDLVAGNAGDNTLLGKAGDDQLNGGAGNDVMHGGAGNDTLYGDAGNDQIHGGTGSDILYGGDGADVLYGGAGSDSIVFMNATAFNNIDVIQDLSITENDSINIADILSLYNPGSDVITDFVQITDNGTDSTLFVDVDGGADNFVAIASIVGVTGLTDEVALETSGNLIAA